jgi:hypothetical protein
MYTEYFDRLQNAFPQKGYSTHTVRKLFSQPPLPKTDEKDSSQGGFHAEGVVTCLSM